MENINGDDRRPLSLHFILRFVQNTNTPEQRPEIRVENENKYLSFERMQMLAYP